MMHNRKLKNYLLRPSVQIRIGLYFIVVSLIFVGIFAWSISSQFGTIFETILDLTDVKEEVLEVINEHIRDAVFWTVSIAAAFVACNILLAIWYTHRLVGPGIAFKRHLDGLIRGDYQVRTTLRQHDAFHDVALRLNALSDELGSKQPPEAEGKEESA